MPVLSKKFLDIQSSIEYRFTLKHVRDMIITSHKKIENDGFYGFILIS